MNMPNEEIIENMEKLMGIASDFTRLKILFSLIDNDKCSYKNACCGHCEKRTCMVEKCVSDIMKETDCSQSLISHQLRVLKDANLVSIRKEGTKAFYRISDGHVKELLKVVLEHVMEEGENND